MLGRLRRLVESWPSGQPLRQGGVGRLSHSERFARVGDTYEELTDESVRLCSTRWGV